jgi:hypothetical protein
MDQLIDAVQRQAGISNEQAQRAVAAMLSFLSARLPSPLVGRIQSLFDQGEPSDRTDNERG